MKKALIIVDLQYDFMPGGALAVGGGDEAVKPINELLRTKKYDLVVATQDWHPSRHASFASTHGKEVFSKIDLHGVEQVMWPDHCVQGTHGAELHKDLDLALVAVILRKGMNANVDSYSAFFSDVGPNGRESTGLSGMLEEMGITEIDVVGLAFDFCVKFTAIDGAEEGFNVRVLKLMTRSVFPENDQKTNIELKEAGVAMVP